MVPAWLRPHRRICFERKSKISVSITFRSISTWPDKSTPAIQRKRSPFQATWAKTIDLLEDELGRVDAKNVVIEVDCDPSEIRIDGHLRANAKLRGSGVVVSFDSPKGALRFPCDRFDDWKANVRGIALSLQALRTVDRYGVTQLAEQYKGWTALPDTRNEQKSKQQAAAEWMVQRLHANTVGVVPSVQEIIGNEDCRRSAYKTLAAMMHPDKTGGDDTYFRELQKHMTAFS